MSAHDTTAVETHQPGTKKLFMWVWFWLLILTGVEVLLAYMRLEPHLMLILLIGLSLIKSALIVAYFMHLRFEKIGLFLIIVPSLVFCLVMILIFVFPDSLRIVRLHP
ncbi:MAG TPA: cytochrome C oxidase subunit IV family protein [Candidatus Sulfotelmatobacter sp.]|nr:cytochrome C oxidase subunit IV family protein [Candidatus Acidoferrales bacterium]HEV2400109.1 cytochrome C oxidase subunit IV family protein [Candidatus Sulfotelmatobacter sp.]